MKRNKKVVFYIVLITSLFNCGFSNKTGNINELRLITENYPPFNFEHEGMARGISSDILGEMLKRLDTKLTQKNIEILPWARGFEMAKHQPNTLLFSTTRTKDREKKFKWVGPIVEAGRVEGHDILLGKKENNIKIKNIEDLKNYNIGVVRGDVVEERLENMGVPDIKIQPVATLEQNFKKLEYGRIDLIGYGEVAMEILTDFGYDINEYEKVYTIATDPSYVYFALNLKTDDIIINKLQKAFDELKKEGVVDKIINSYIEEKALD